MGQMSSAIGTVFGSYVGGARTVQERDNVINDAFEKGRQIPVFDEGRCIGYDGCRGIAYFQRSNRWIHGGWTGGWQCDKCAQAFALLKRSQASALLKR